MSFKLGPDALNERQFIGGLIVMEHSLLPLESYEGRQRGRQMQMSSLRGNRVVFADSSFEEAYLCPSKSNETTSQSSSKLSEYGVVVCDSPILCAER